MPAMSGDEMQHDAIDEARHALPPFAKATKGRSRAYDPGRPSTKCVVCGRTRLDTRDDADGLATARLTDLHVSLDQRVERVIAPAADIRTGMELGAALADENLTGVDGLAAEPLHA